MSRQSVRRTLAGAVAALLLAGGFTVACTPAPAEPPVEAVRQAAPAAPVTELWVRGPAYEPAVLELQTGRGAHAGERDFRQITLPYSAELPEGVTSVSVSYLGDSRRSVEVLGCQTVRDGQTIEQDSDPIGSGAAIVSCSTGR